MCCVDGIGYVFCERKFEVLLMAGGTVTVTRVNLLRRLFRLSDMKQVVGHGNDVTIKKHVCISQCDFRF